MRCEQIEKDIVAKIKADKDPPDRLAVPPIVASQLSGRADEVQHRHLDLHQSGAGKCPGAGKGRRIGVEIRKLRPPNRANPIQAHRASDRGKAQNQHQAGENRVHAVTQLGIPVLIRYHPDQDRPFHPGRTPPQHERRAAEKEQSVKSIPLPGRREIQKD
jgi:hypothetical protein